MHFGKQHQGLDDERPNWNLLIFAVITLVAICLACGTGYKKIGVGPKNIQVDGWPFRQCDDEDTQADERAHACGIVASTLIEGNDIVTGIKYALIACEGNGSGCSHLAWALKTPGGISVDQRIALREKAYDYCMNHEFTSGANGRSGGSTANVCSSVAEIYREDEEIQKLGLKANDRRWHDLLKRACDSGDTNDCRTLNNYFDSNIDVEAVQRENDRKNEDFRRERAEERAEQARFEATQKPLELPTLQPDAIQGALNHQMTLMNTAPTGGSTAPPISAPDPVVTWPDMGSNTETPSKPPAEKAPDPTPPAKTSEPPPAPPPPTTPAPSATQPPSPPPPPPPPPTKEEKKPVCTKRDGTIQLVKFLADSSYCKTNKLGNNDILPVLKNTTTETISCRVCGGTSGVFGNCVNQTWYSQESIGGWATPLVWCDVDQVQTWCYLGAEGITGECLKRHP